MRRASVHGVGRRVRPAAAAAIAATMAGALVLGGCSQGSTAASSPDASHTGAPDLADVVPSGAVWQPDQARMPADLTAAPVRCPAPADGWQTTEDQQLGEPGFQVPPDDGPVTGYADRGSAGCGDTVGVSLSGPVSRVQLRAYRVGAYRDSTVRLVWMSPEVQVVPRAMPPLQSGTRLREPAWPVSVRVPVTAQWPPGLYLLVPHAAGGPAGPAIPLIVRDEVGRAPALFVASTMTWNAYNEWGGYSLYHGPGRTAAARFATRARVASFRRPLVGAGYRQLVNMDLPVVSALERSGVGVACVTDVDVDQRPSQLLKHAEVVVGGHSEYWTRREYDALAVARSSAVNLVFLGANNLWWHARLSSRLPSGVEPDRETVNRVAAGDPVLPGRPQDLTLLWSQWPEHRDPATILGQSHAGIDVDGGYQLLGAPAWLLAGTGLHAGTATTPGSVLPQAVGNEADGYNPLGSNPKDLTVIAVGVLKGAQGPVAASVSYYVTPAGGGVFSAGTTTWACALQGDCFGETVPDVTAAAVRAMTRNVFLAFALPRAGLTHPSVPGIPPPPQTLLGVLAPAAIGTYGTTESTEESGSAHRGTR